VVSGAFPSLPALLIDTKIGCSISLNFSQAVKAAQAVKPKEEFEEMKAKLRAEGWNVS
jgi:hypothetical protein